MIKISLFFFIFKYIPYKNTTIINKNKNNSIIFNINKYNINKDFTQLFFFCGQVIHQKSTPIWLFVQSAEYFS